MDLEPSKLQLSTHPAIQQLPIRLFIHLPGNQDFIDFYLFRTIRIRLVLISKQRPSGKKCDTRKNSSTDESKFFLVEGLPRKVLSSIRFYFYAQFCVYKNLVISQKSSEDFRLAKFFWFFRLVQGDVVLSIKSQVQSGVAEK